MALFDLLDVPPSDISLRLVPVPVCTVAGGCRCPICLSWTEGFATALAMYCRSELVLVVCPRCLAHYQVGVA